MLTQLFPQKRSYAMIEEANHHYIHRHTYIPYIQSHITMYVYTYVSNQHIAHIKLTQCYMSNIFH